MNPVDLEKKIRKLEIEARKHRDAEELLKVQKAYLELLLDSAPEAILLADKHHGITRINPQFSKMFGFSLEEVIGKPADDLLVPPEKRQEPPASRIMSARVLRFDSKAAVHEKTAPWFTWRE